ncbi:Sec-independent protein translocase protein TatB [Mangrovibrevibacter kandeliae]|uniref:Sec-independent protein translocase protein TatB n=1 Tax=Mangrovibrevibacter kandeliae TaxID=2968473 RepID=UPI0021191449|nr:Sec-independent protein translocase protein TatB [Aurantimonas sp. CSK15Z-1]MCW4114882.1 Sec-independent protein translocase protein TatB [Aurantimonas sp. MSK8Z-1]
MFDIGWSELLVIAVVLIVVVGPKDLPRMLRTFGKTTSQLRRMAGDFRKQFDEALREAELDDVRDTVRDLKSLDPRSEMRKALNPMRAVGDEIRASLSAATKAPEPRVPSADEPAKPAEPVPQPAMAEAAAATGAARPAGEGDAALAQADAPKRGDAA